LRNIKNIEHQWWATVLSFVFLLFVATTLFNVIKNSVEQIWNIGQSSKRNLYFTLKARSRSMGIILLAGALFFISLLAEGFQTEIIDTAGFEYQQQGIWLVWLFNQAIFTLTVSLWFAIVFRFLTNARPGWLITLKGGLLTGILFNLGRYILRILLPMSNIEGIYGASGSIVLLMLFVFYSALIFYFGACFIRIISENASKDMRLKNGAFRYEIKEL
jgi:membrane protein